MVILRPFLAVERHLGRLDVSPQQVGLAEAAWLPEGQDSLPRSSSGVSNGLFFYESLFESFPSVRQVTALIAGSVIIRFDCE